MRSLRIEPLAGYSPNVGRLVCMLTYARQTLLDSVAGLSRSDLDHLHDGMSNSIGALLAHAVAVERYYQLITLENRDPVPEDLAAAMPALELGDAGRRSLRGRDLAEYVDDLAAVRQITLAALAGRDDDWLERPLRRAADINPHWAWFHVAEDEFNHRGQIRWLRRRLPARDPWHTVFRSSVPSLLVGDVDATATWYGENLGFHTAGIFPASRPSVWASLQRDGAEIMLQRLEGYRAKDLYAQRPGGVWHVYIRTTGVHRLYESVRGQPFIKMPLRRQPYGDWEFEIEDRNGYVIVFGGDETLGSSPGPVAL